MRQAPLLAAFVTLLTLSRPAPADSRFDLTLAGFVDDASGTSFDLDASVAPFRWLRFSAGAGRSESSDTLTAFRGESLRFAADVHSERVGARAYYDEWSDADEFTSRKVGAVASIFHRGFELSLIGESRRFDVDFALLVQGRPVARSERFDGSGFGASVGYYGARWGGFVRGMSYDYDRRFDALISASRSPTIARFPRLDALAGSILTRTQGALEHDVTAGVERAFTRSSLRAELTNVRDAVFGAEGNSLSASYRFAFSPRSELELTGGMDDTEGLGSAAFAGVVLLLHL